MRLSQASALYIRGRFAEALPLLERIRPIAQATADPVLRAQFPRVYGQLQALRGDYAEAVPALHEAISLHYAARCSCELRCAMQRVTLGVVDC